MSSSTTTTAMKNDKSSITLKKLDAASIKLSEKHLHLDVKKAAPSLPW